MDFMIRPAQVDDAAGMVALLNPIIAAGRYTRMTALLTVAEQLDFIRSFPAHGVFLVAVTPDGRHLLGLQDVQPLAGGGEACRHVGEISTFVALTVRRRGLGEALSQATFAAGQAQGFRKLMATIRGDNPPAVAFYLRQGFRIIGTAQQHAFSGGKYVDEILAEKFIG